MWLQMMLLLLYRTHTYLCFNSLECANESRVENVKLKVGKSKEKKSYNNFFCIFFYIVLSRGDRKRINSSPSRGPASVRTRIFPGLTISKTSGLPPIICVMPTSTLEEYCVIVSRWMVHAPLDLRLNVNGKSDRIIPPYTTTPC